MSEDKEDIYFVMESDNSGMLFETISKSQERTEDLYLCMDDLRELDVSCIQIKIIKIPNP